LKCSSLLMTLIVNKIELDYSLHIICIMNNVSYHEFFLKMYIIKLARDRAKAREYFRALAVSRNLARIGKTAS